MCAARRAYRCGHRGRRRTARIQRIGAAAGRFAACDHGGPEPSLQRGQARLARCPPSPHNHGIDSLTCTSNSCTSFCSGCAHRNSREAERCEDLARGFGGDVELCVDAAEHRWRGRSLRRLPVSGHSRSRLRKPGSRRDEYKRSPHRVRWLVSLYRVGLSLELQCRPREGGNGAEYSAPRRRALRVRASRHCAYFWFELGMSKAISAKTDSLAGRDGNVSLISLATGNVVHFIKCHNESCSAVGVMDDGFVTISYDQSWKLWKLY
jgi:hypothetical protein